MRAFTEAGSSPERVRASGEHKLRRSMHLWQGELFVCSDALARLLYIFSCLLLRNLIICPFYFNAHTITYIKIQIDWIIRKEKNHQISDHKMIHKITENIYRFGNIHMLSKYVSTK